MNNLNSSITLGMINIINNIPLNNKQITNNNIYLNSINDCIDYKIKGNIYKTQKEELIYLYPNIENIVRNKSLEQKKQLKILKFDKEILSQRAKTPTKIKSKNFYFNLMKNNNINININNNEDYAENYTHSTHSPNNSDNLSNDNTQCTKNNYVKNDFISIDNINNNSNIKNNSQYNNNINNNIKRNTYIKKKSPNKKYIINKTTLNNIEKKNININVNVNMNNNQKNNLNKKYTYKILDKQPKKIIIYSKNKDKSKIINSIKSKNTINYKQNNLNLDLNNISSNYNNNYYTQNNKKETPKTARNKNINYIQNKKKISINKDRNKLLLTPNKNITKIRTNNINNKNLNIQYNPTISNNISRNTSGGVVFNNKNLPKKYTMNYHTIGNDKNDINNQNNQNKNLYKKVQTANNDNINNIYQTKTFVGNNKKKKNNVFENDENSIFKILDNTQIITPEDCGSSTNSNNFYQFNASGSNSNGTNTNQDTDYNSIKKFKNSFMKEDNYYLENEHKNFLQNNGNLRIEDNFSFNNL